MVCGVGGAAGTPAEGEGSGRRRLPVHTPILRLAGEPKSQKRPLCGSQGSRSVHSSPSCLAHTRQQPQPSSTRLTPAGQRGAGAAAHWHGPPQSWPAAGCGEEEAVSGRTPLGGPGPAPPRTPSPTLPPQPPPGAGRRGAPRLTRPQRANRSTKAQRTGPRPAADMVWRCGRGGRRAECGGGAGAAVPALGRGLGLEVGAGAHRAEVWELSAGAAAVGGRRSVAGVGVALAASSQREELLCESAARGPRLLYAPGGPGSPMS